MTRDYGRVKTQFWESETMRGLSPENKFLGLYLLTSPHTNTIGCFRLPIAYMVHDTGMPIPALENAFAALRGADFVKWCERTPWIWLPKYLRHNPPENPNVWRKCVKELEALPTGEAQVAIAAELLCIATEARMCNPTSKTRVTEEERSRLKRYEYGIGTVSKGSHPLPCPSSESITEPSSSLRSDGARESDDAETPSDPKPKTKTGAGTRWQADARIPDDWFDDAQAQCHEDGMPLPDLRREAGKFERYWASKPGSAGRKVDWRKTWINWVLKAAEDERERSDRRRAPERGLGIAEAAQHALDALSRRKGEAQPGGTQPAAARNPQNLPAIAGPERAAGNGAADHRALGEPGGGLPSPQAQHGGAECEIPDFLRRAGASLRSPNRPIVSEVLDATASERLFPDTGKTPSSSEGLKVA